MKSIQITTTPRIDEKTKSVNIMLEGELILKYLNGLATQVKEIITEYDDITIELKNIINMDLAGIQLLLSAKQTAVVQQKPITCKAELPAEINNILKHAGLADLPAKLNQ